MIVSEEAKERKRANDRRRYREKAEEMKAYQRQYYADHREQILRRRRERGFDKVKIR